MAASVCGWNRASGRRVELVLFSLVRAPGAISVMHMAISCGSIVALSRGSLGRVFFAVLCAVPVSMTVSVGIARSCCTGGSWL